MKIKMPSVRAVVSFWIIFVNIPTKGDTKVVKNHTRKERAVIFPASSTLGLFVAIAIPLDLPNRNVFLSYNFEANYNLPYQGSDIFPGVDQRFEVDFEAEDAGPDDPNAVTGSISRHLEGDISVTENPNPEKQKKKKKKGKKKGKKKKKKQKVKSDNKQKRSFPMEASINRRNMYKMLEEKFRHHGYKGKPCLLRTICEVNRDNIGFYNGLTGSVIHMIFKPTSSEHEGISNDYYDAEEHGMNGDCTMYHAICPESILEIISKEYDPIEFD